jgi:hypothetical protein
MRMRKPSKSKCQLLFFAETIAPSSCTLHPLNCHIFSTGFPPSRDRNREHAKNTRLRKKAYVLKLKELVDQMNGQKDMEEKERRALGERIHDTVHLASLPLS